MIIQELRAEFNEYFQSPDAKFIHWLVLPAILHVWAHSFRIWSSKPETWDFRPFLDSGHAT